MVTQKFLGNLLMLMFVSALGLLLVGYTSIVIVLAAALAVKHMAYILINGNIFQELRTYFTVNSTEAESSMGRWLNRKMYVLFSCNLCMTMQLSFWIIAIPTAVVFHLKYFHPLERFTQTDLPGLLEGLFTALVIFLFAVVVAALAMAWWRIVEYPQDLIEAMAALKKQELALARAKLIGSDGKAPLGGITKTDIMGVFEKLHKVCYGASYCRTALRSCFENRLPLIIRELARAKGWNSRDEQVLLSWISELELDELYVQAMYREFGDKNRYDQIRKELSDKFFESAALSA